jgi:hypothetical protein
MSHCKERKVEGNCNCHSNISTHMTNSEYSPYLHSRRPRGSNENISLSASRCLRRFLDELIYFVPTAFISWVGRFQTVRKNSICQLFPLILLITHIVYLNIISILILYMEQSHITLYFCKYLR